MVKAPAPGEVKFRKDYTPTPYLVDTIELSFDLKEDVSTVIAKSTVKPNNDGGSAEMFLNGREDVVLESVSINGSALAADKYEKAKDSLTLKDLPSEAFELEIVTKIKPQENTSLEGIYKSGGNFCSQCEAEGFRGITYFYDRPDVMSKYKVRIEADKAAYPVLLSNGNLIESGDASEGRHFTVWEDPWPKPCYLFALVAGTLKCKEDIFITHSGKQVRLCIYVQEQNFDKVDFAMQSLKDAMMWDERRYGLEYDLDLFNIVAVDDFNMGAMENKSLNIFNSRLVLATPETATDMDFSRIQGVVGHEYFHNWTGNRVTCRDWFQLTLKEGLTVYRDSEFTSDLNSRPVKRIEDVMMMRTAQFAEDAGPMAHPIRPDSYIKMDNFYTVTVYEKGCEVIRMYETILGREGFRKGMDLYFKRHDGQAVTCDDFLSAMAHANDEDLSSLAKWYGQAGTPKITISTEYDASTRAYTVTVKQATPPTKDQPNKIPVLIPVKMGLLGSDGKEIEFEVTSGRAKQHSKTEAVLLAEEETSKFVLSGVSEEPVPSFLREFSAPVNMDITGQSEEQLLFILANDTDPFNRWDAGQRLARNMLLKMYDAACAMPDSDPETAFVSAGGVQPALVDAFRAVLLDDSVDGSTTAMMLTLPSQSELVQAIDHADPVLVHKTRGFAVKTLAQRLMNDLITVLKANKVEPGTPYKPDAPSVARRAVSQKCLSMLCATGEERFRQQALEAYKEATNMTTMTGAITAVLDVDCPERTEMLESFYKRWEKEPLVVLKWLAMIATSNKPDNLEQVRSLVGHPAFNITNPNNCYSLFLAMARSPLTFHAADGSGYAFMADMVMKVDSINRQVAARMAGTFTSYQQVDKSRQALIQEQLKRIIEHEGLSENVAEIVSKSIES